MSYRNERLGFDSQLSLAPLLWASRADTFLPAPAVAYTLLET